MNMNSSKKQQIMKASEKQLLRKQTGELVDLKLDNSLIDKLQSESTAKWKDPTAQLNPLDPDGSDFWPIPYIYPHFGQLCTRGLFGILSFLKDQEMVKICVVSRHFYSVICAYFHLKFVAVYKQSVPYYVSLAYIQKLDLLEKQRKFRYLHLYFILCIRKFFCFFLLIFFFFFLP